MDADLDLFALVSQILMGIGLSAACGLRAFLPCFLVGIFERAGYLTLGDHFTWMGSTPSLIVFGTAVLVEILGDKFPYIDHLLDSAALFVKPVAGAMLASAAIVHLNPMLAAVLGLITGGTVASVVHVGKAGARVASTALTGGLANPLLSVAEDVAGTGLSIASILAPIVAFVMLLVGGYALVRLIRRRRTLPATA